LWDKKRPWSLLAPGQIKEGGFWGIVFLKQRLPQLPAKYYIILFLKCQCFLQIKKGPWFEEGRTKAMRVAQQFLPGNANIAAQLY